MSDEDAPSRSEVKTWLAIMMGYINYVEAHQDGTPNTFPMPWDTARTDELRRELEAVKAELAELKAAQKDSAR